MLFGLLAAFYNAPEGVAAPLAHALGGGAAAVGVILAANCPRADRRGARCSAASSLPPTRLRFMGPLAICACGVLVLFFWRPGLYVSLLILVASGLCAAYQLAANAAFVQAAPQEQRSQAFGASPGRDEPGSGRSHDPGGGRSRTSLPGPGHRGVRRGRRRRSAGGRGQRRPRLVVASGGWTPSAGLRSAPLVVAHGGAPFFWCSGVAGGRVRSTCCRAWRGSVPLVLAGAGGRVRSTWCRAWRPPFVFSGGGRGSRG